MTFAIANVSDLWSVI